MRQRHVVWYPCEAVQHMDKKIKHTFANIGETRDDIAQVIEIDKVGVS